jgi:hypothetical protein
MLAEFGGNVSTVKVMNGVAVMRLHDIVTCVMTKMDLWTFFLFCERVYFVNENSKSNRFGPI